jgi:hypothetical protein
MFISISPFSFYSIYSHSVFPIATAVPYPGIGLTGRLNKKAAVRKEDSLSFFTEYED